MQEQSSEEWTRAHEKNLRTTDYTVTGLTAGKKYFFIVAAVNVNGMGDFSDPCAEVEPVERIGKIPIQSWTFVLECKKTMSS